MPGLPIKNTGVYHLKGFARYATRKLFWYLLTLIVALMLNFFLPRLIPGNPVDVLLSELTAGMNDTAQAQAMKEEFYRTMGLDKPLIVQFFNYVGNLLHGDMGRSFTQYPRVVEDILASALPWTIGIQLPSILVGWILGNLLGALTAYKKGMFDKVMFPLFLFFSSLPAFVFALLLQYFLGVQAGWFPVQGGYAFNILPGAGWAYYMSLFRHWQLPFLTTVIIMIGGQAIGMRSMSLYELNVDYVLYSKLLGIRDRKITRYVFRNAVLPQITGLALSLGTMVGGALITETIFSYPGIGLQMMKAIRNIDYTLISGCTLVISITVLVANFLVDMLIGVLDPRVRAAQTEEG